MKLDSLLFYSSICSVLFFTTKCAPQENDSNVFVSDFNTSSERNWIGPEYWANPLQDWQVKNGEIESLVSKKNRNIHLLTKKLDSISGNLSMSVDIKAFNLEVKSPKNWLGFSVGSSGEFNDYRDDAIFGIGLDAGITTKGNLFIGEIDEADSVNNELQQKLKEGVTLILDLEKVGESYMLILTVRETSSNIVLAKKTREDITPKILIGDLVLVSNYEGAEFPNKKSATFKNWKLTGTKIKSYPENTFGPVLFSQYTLSKGVLKITAQMAPVLLSEEQVRFSIKKNNEWEMIKKAPIDPDARTATFTLPDWDTSDDIPYKLSYNLDVGISRKQEYSWEGTIRKDPINKETLIVAGFTGNDHTGFPNSEITNNVKKQNLDVLFFSGDQIYEPNGGFGAQRSPIDKSTLDYLRKWYMYGWAYRDLMKDRPTVSITDDHDVYHGNIWGAGGKAIPEELGQGAEAQDAGGYKMPARWVNMVQRTQTSHLPSPYDDTPVAQGINTYYTDMVYGGISFAILEDRKFKSAPKSLLKKASIRNGWIQNSAFDVKTEADVPEAVLLGERQLTFLENWVSDWSYNAEMKMLLSQTIFANVATLPQEATSGAVIPTLRIMHKGDYAPNDRAVSDFDSNGWPQSGRNKAVEMIRKGFVFHLAGDQHLGSTIQYEVDKWGDSGFAFCVPSITNHWPRRWYPSVIGRNRDPEKPKYTGEFEDGFGNKMTVHAVSNPLFSGKKPEKIYDRAAGYGIVRLNKKSREITVECWPRGADVSDDNEQYDGWPITINQQDNYGKKAAGFLPEIKIAGCQNPVVQVIDESNSEVVYTLRIKGTSYRPKVFDSKASYTLKVGKDLDSNDLKVFENLVPNDQKEVIRVNLDCK